MATNPILSEIQGLSPGAQAALGIAGHALSQGAANPAPAMNAPVVTPQMKSAAQPQDAGPAPQLAPIKMPGSDSVPSLGGSPNPNIHVLGSSPLGTLQGDKDELQRKLTTGSGESQIMHRIEGTGFGQAHPMLGKILGGAAQGVATLGDIGLSTVAPQIAEQLPGTAYHHNLDVNRENRQVASDEGNAEKEAQTGEIGANTAHTQAETAGLPQAAADKHALDIATTGNLNSEAKDRDAAQQNPPLATAYAHAVNQAIKEGRDPSADPIVQHLSDAITSLQPGQNKTPEAPKTITAVRPGSNGPREYAWNPKTQAYDIDEGAHYEKPQVVNVNAGTAALDRETKQFGTPHQKAVDAANAQLEKIEDARSMINGNAESQALGVPKVLTALVGGQGTGVRITTPELNAIAKARGLSGDVEGMLNKWAGQGSLTKTQQQQLTSIMDAVKQRIIQKQAIAGEALDKINGAGSRDEIVQADKEARQKLSDMEKGGAQPQNGSAISVTAPNGKSYNFPDQASAEKFKKDAGIK
jgi:hypothetical protein